MASEQSFHTTLDRIKAFEALPMTDEKHEIQRRFVSDEISHLEYLMQASEYLSRESE